MRRLATVSALAVTLQVSVAVAQSDEAPTERGVTPPVDSPKGDLVRLAEHPEAELLVNVELTGNDPSVQYEIRSTLSDSVLLVCHDTCSFRIWPGRYRLLTLSSRGRVQGEEPLLVDQDSRITVTTPAIIEPILGAALTVAGAAAFVFGAYYFKQSTCDDKCSGRTARDDRMGVAFMLSGAVTVPVGVLLLTSGLEPEVTLAPADLTLDEKSERVLRASVRRLTWALSF